MRVICLIPSITETLIECGINVVGRTRYCIHPAGIVKSIAIVGGTKRVDAAQFAALKPDLINLEREENTKETAQSLYDLKLNVHVIHVTNLQSLAIELKKIALVFSNSQLDKLSMEVAALAKKSKLHHPDLRKNFLIKACFRTEDIQNFFQLESQVESLLSSDQMNYVIWKKPWMMIGPGTYIEDVLAFAGFRLGHQSPEKYPKTEVLPSDHLLLFSSEPYPFLSEWEAIKKNYPQSLLVDGEKISWFGIRSLRFLASL
ncbi:MAG: helical backbone metal receptor [Pseudobdellovibrionaceae bacterium]